jgi:ABC-type Fe3+/spermidine/putrescine transport system ATPase subunit
MTVALHVNPMPAPSGAMALETYELTKRFGSFTALDRVTMKVTPGTVHALLGENGAGKSTLVKCIAGFHRAEQGSIVTDGREQDIANPVVARALGIGMVYQHFTLAPGMTVAENLLLAGGRTPAVIDWPRQRAQLNDFWPPRRSGSTWTRARRNCGRRETEAGTAQAAVPETAPADPGRADLGADAAGGRRGAGPRARLRTRRPVYGTDDHAQVPRGDGLCRRRDGAAARPAGAVRQRLGHLRAPAGAGDGGRLLGGRPRAGRSGAPRPRDR